MIMLLLLTLVPSDIFFMSLHYDDGNILIESVDVIDGYPTISSEGDYEMTVYSINGDVLSKGWFDPPIIAYSPIPLPGDTRASENKLTQVDFSVSVPYNPLGHTITVRKNSTVHDTIDVSMFKRYCGDGICQFEEVCTLDCVENIDNRYGVFIVLGIVVFLVLLFVFLKRVRRVS